MRKSLLYLFAMIGTLSAFTSCGDDEKTPEWQGLSKDYATENLKLTLNGKEMTGQSVNVVATAENKATIKLYLGSLDAKRDWGHAKDYIEAMWLILQQDEPDDYCIATGTTTSIRDFVKMAFGEIGVELMFSGEGVNEKAVIISVNQTVFTERVGDEYYEEMAARIGNIVLEVDPAYFRPTEVDLLIGDATKARTKLGWKPKYNLQMLVEEMMKSDVHLFKKDAYLKKGGFYTMNYFE